MSLSLHVGNLPFSVKSRDLASVFENLSGYEDAKVTVDGNSKSRGFGLVTFANAGAAAAAMESLQGNPIGEGDKAREMKIAEPRKPREAGAGAGEAGAKDAAPRAAKKSRSRKNKGTERTVPTDATLYVSNLPWSVTHESLNTAFGVYGELESARVVMRGTRSRGFGFVSFKDEASATAAMSKLNGSPMGEGENVREISLQKANSAPPVEA